MVGLPARVAYKNPMDKRSTEAALGHLLDLRHLRTFVAIAEEQNLTRGAEKVHISQPAASAQIRSLEETLKIALFRRTNRGLVLTDAGTSILSEARNVLKAAGRLSLLAREHGAMLSGPVNIGSNFDPSLSGIGRIVNALREAHPGVEINVSFRNPRATRQGLVAGELDGGFLLGVPQEDDLDTRVLKVLGYRLAGPYAWRDRVEDASWAELAALPWILTPAGGCHWDMLQELFGNRGLKVNGIMHANSESVIRSMILDHVGVSLLRDDWIAEAEASRQMCSSPIAASDTNLLFSTARSRGDDKVVKALRQAVETVWP